MLVIGRCARCRKQYDLSDRPAGARLSCPCGGSIRAPQPEQALDLHVGRCASCGGARVSDAPVCSYCGARFTSMDLGWGLICPECFCRLPNDARFCVHCGLGLSPQKFDRELPATLSCPRCAAPMQAREVEGALFHECANCGGLWTPRKVFDAICEKREALGVARHAADIFAPPRQAGPPQNQPVRYLPCPCCGEFMNRKNFGNASGVIIDVCRKCGVWFDYQELKQVVEFIESGGWERAKRREAEEERLAAARRASQPAPPIGLGLGPSEGSYVRVTGDLRHDFATWVVRGGLEIVVKMLKS